MSKILYYNWVPFDNEKGLGGGVSVYIKNIIGEMILNSDFSVYFLSCGYKYNPLRKDCYYKACKNIYGKKCKTYEIINSPIIAPLGNLAWDMDKYINDEETLNIFKKFLEEEGPFDVVHICNIGGFGQKTLTLKKYFPNTKFIFDLHNYNSVCMNSFLFNHFESKKCDDYSNGQKCLSCYSKMKIQQSLYQDRVSLYWKNNIFEKLLYKLKNNFKNKYKKEYNKYYVCNYKKNKSTQNSFQNFRENNIKYINEYFDDIIAVSRRVKEVAVSYGLKEDKISVSYIGTKFADVQKKPKEINCSKKLKIVYLGYANVLKGFYFLINVLQKLPIEYARQIDLVFAAKNAKEKYVLEKLSMFNSVKVYDGYSHEKLNHILADIDLGIVPVLWEDNLPQVAIEIVSNGIPILCRNLGGASELSDSKDFIFENEEELLNKLINIVNNKKLLCNYWEKHKPLTTMNQNFNYLKKIYRG